LRCLTGIRQDGVADDEDPPSAAGCAGLKLVYLEKTEIEHDDDCPFRF